MAPPPDQTGRAPVEVPPRFTASTNESSRTDQGWLHDWAQPELSRLVEETLRNNYDLRSAAARLDAAGANRLVAASFRRPEITATAGASRSKQVFENPATGKIESEHANQYGLGLGLFWELDLWGRLKNRAQAALADWQAAEAEYRAARLSLAANVVKAWFNAVESELQVRLARETVESFESNLAVVESSFKRGIRPALDVRLTRANVEAARSNLLLQRRLRDAAARALEVLLGRYPANEIAVADTLPSLPKDVPPGLPAALLHRRPDLVAAERRLAASVESLRESRKELLPTISLTANGGTSSEALQDLLDAERLAWRIAGNLAQPLFQGGRVRAGIRLADAQSRQALADFAQAVLAAFQEVETFLAAETYLKDQEVALRLAAEESGLAEALALQEYNRGLSDIITVLESQRRAFNARSSLLNITHERLRNRVNLHLALGGDFRPGENLETKRLAEVSSKP